MVRNKDHYWKVVWVAMALPIVFALLDLLGAAMWAQAGGWGADAYVIMGRTYQTLFWTFAYVVILGIALTYYITTKDKSESLALAIIPSFLLQMGVEDIYFYFIGSHDLWNATLPWLTENLWIPTWISRAFGEPVITGPVLLLSGAIGYAGSYILARQLVKVK